MSEPLALPGFRPLAEVQRAHDLLSAVVCGEVPLDLSPEWRLALHASADVLCWALQHDHNLAFEDNLNKVAAAAAAQGYRLARIIEVEPEIVAQIVPLPLPRLPPPTPKHTPGPWTVDLTREFLLGGDTVSVEATNEDGSLIMREVCNLMLDTDEHPDGAQWLEDCANARLISAAPDLYQVASTLAFAFEQGIPGGLEDAFNGAKTALAKVYGVPESEMPAALMHSLLTALQDLGSEIPRPVRMPSQRPNRRHRCATADCQRWAPDGFLCCRRCWGHLPFETRQSLGRAWHAHLRDTSDPRALTALQTLLQEAAPVIQASREARQARAQARRERKAAKRASQTETAEAT